MKREATSGKAAYALKMMDHPEARRMLDAWTSETGRTPFAFTFEDFFLPAPEITLTAEKKADFGRLLQATLDRGIGSVIDYRSASPKHEFLYYMVQRRGCVLHGSNRIDIDIMRPVRKSLEAKEGNPLGNINGVYATPDEMWPMFFALVDRIHHDVWLINGPFDGPDAAGATRKFYQFSINVESLRQRPYADGMIYILPGETFEYAGGAERASRVAGATTGEAARVAGGFSVSAADARLQHAPSGLAGRRRLCLPERNRKDRGALSPPLTGGPLSRETHEETYTPR